MKISLKTILLLIVIVAFINQVNSVHNTKKFNLIFFKNIEKKEFLFQSQSLDISYKMKQQSIQQMALSCEISATADILSFLMNEKVSETKLLKQIEKSKYNEVSKEINGEIYWGNPEEGFVGYIDKLPNGEIARQKKMTGYGVLEKPIEKLIKTHGFKTTIINKYDYSKNFNEKDHLKLILENIKIGNMVQLWGDICTNPKYYSGEEYICSSNGELSWNKNRDIYWNYIDKNGNTVKYKGLNGEHAFYLLGYKGRIDNPTHIIVWDTLTGKHSYVTSEWMRKWEKMQYRSIIIYNK